MTTAQLTGPIPISRVWSGTKVLAEDLAGEDLGDVLDLHDDASAWWVLDRSSDYARDELERLLVSFDLDRLVATELLATDHRAKFEEFGPARLILTNALSVDERTAEITVHPVSVLVTDRALVCLVDVRGGVDPARWLAGAVERLAKGGTEGALQVVTMAVVDSYERVVDWLEQSSDEVADELFAGTSLAKDRQLWTFRLRTALTDLRRVTEPMRTVMTDLRDNQRQSAATAKRAKRSLDTRPWAMIVERHDRVANAADSLRETLNSVFETSLALADVQLNLVMKKLSGWAAIIAVPTLVTSFVGMNVGFPLVDSHVGFWVYLVLMLVSAAALYLVFKRKEWI
ncbi:MAG: hypothetical protein L0H41_13895 [Microlunatus sp.]|nr:hypothetical protein [Microlunatus sp.]MDN5771258.1 hypothetical protein [Microlunatus sp.]MDN5803063.1 hypothetical protein [Microlunatus sp.]